MRSFFTFRFSKNSSFFSLSNSTHLGTSPTINGAEMPTLPNIPYASKDRFTLSVSFGGLGPAFFIALTLFFFAFVSVPVMESKSSISSSLSLLLTIFRPDNFAVKSSALPFLDDEDVASAGALFGKNFCKKLTNWSHEEISASNGSGAFSLSHCFFLSSDAFFSDAYSASRSARKTFSLFNHSLFFFLKSSRKSSISFRIFKICLYAPSLSDSKAFTFLLKLSPPPLLPLLPFSFLFLLLPPPSTPRILSISFFSFCCSALFALISTSFAFAFSCIAFLDPSVPVIRACFAAIALAESFILFNCLIFSTKTFSSFKLIVSCESWSSILAISASICSALFPPPRFPEPPSLSPFPMLSKA
mmetsp:Transcript_6930/g.22958  ORF Transcript_6930/g.22958 Transcript_6930/m.22958 type:complete len:359 (+) Transcript_6930:2290-3366(+)